MTKRSRRRSGRPSRPLTRRANPVRPDAIRWWDRFSKPILAIGAIAGAILTVLTLFLTVMPKHAQQNVARFISVQALSQVPLSEYPRRSTGFKLISADRHHHHGSTLLMAVIGQSSPPSVQGGDASSLSPTPLPTSLSPTPLPTTLSPTPSVTVSTPTGTGSPTGMSSPNCTASPIGTASPGQTVSPGGTASPCTTSPTGTASPGQTASPGATASPSGTASPTGGIESLPPLGMSHHEFGAYANTVAGFIKKLDPGLFLPPCKTHECRVIRLLKIGCLNGDGRAVKPADCAATDVGFFKNGATAVWPPGKQGSSGGGSGNQGSSGGGSGNQGSSGGGSGNQGSSGGGSGNQGS